MDLSLIDLILCPKCIDEGNKNTRKYYLEGDYNDQKIFDGYVTCQFDHKWQVRDELLKLHKALHKGEELYTDLSLDYDEKNFLSENKLTKQDLVPVYQDYSRLEQYLTSHPNVMVTGEFIPFLKRLQTLEDLLIVVDPNEGKLRKGMEVAAMNGYYQFTKFIQAEKITFVEDFQIIHLSLFGQFEGDHGVKFTESGKPLGSKFVDFY